ncbi:MAG: lycopene beta-cyclase CrtY [Pseudomonadota bacterium]
MSDSNADPAVDVAIVGGGLAGGLLALALHQKAPDCRFVVLDAGEALGGNHRWSWFTSDLDDAATDLLSAFPLNAWDDGYEIHFPRYGRELPTGYRSMASEDFHKVLMATLSEGSVRLGTRAQTLDASGVTLDDGSRLDAARVIDCRTFTSSENLAGGWQVFLGQHIRTDKPHGLTRPVIMDATVDQVAPYGNGAAYRFVYVLPLAEDEVFIEDTYYADHPKMDRDQLWSRTQSYAHAKGLDGEVIGHETGILPVVSGGNFDAVLDELRIPGVAIGGSRGGFSHPLTSYTLPFAADNALAIADLIARAPATTGEQLARFCETRARAHWQNMAFYRMLVRMLFEAADPAQRVVVLQRFYGLSGPLVERFYAGDSSFKDKARILTGKPPVTLTRAVRALLSPGIPLSTETPA